MPIGREHRQHYSRRAGWHVVRQTILQRAASSSAAPTCECAGLCGGHRGRCGAPDRGWIVRPRFRRGHWSPAAAGDAGAVRVILAVAHLNHRPGDDRPENLAALCQRCHLLLDLSQHWASRRRAAWVAARERGQRDLLLDLEASS